MALKSDVVAIDNGLMNLKGKSKHGEIIFQNKFSEGHTDVELKGKNTFNVSYGKKEWTIGENASRTHKLEGKDSEFHIVSALTAITKLFPKKEFTVAEEKNPNGKEMVLMYGESINRYFNDEHKQELRELFEGTHVIMVDGEVYKFTILFCHVLPEGIGHIIQNLEAYSGIRYTVDMGGGTINFTKTINGRPDETSFSVGLGMHNITAKVQNELSREKVGAFDEDMVKQYIRFGCDRNDINMIIERVIFNQFKELDDKLAGFGIDLHKLLEIHFIGGTSQQLSSQIRKYYKNAIVYEDSLYANVKGYYEYGRVKYAL